MGDWKINKDDVQKDEAVVTIIIIRITRKGVKTIFK